MEKVLSDMIASFLPFQPNKGQKELLDKLAVFMLNPAVDKPLFLLRGYAGTGKTSVVAALVKTLRQLDRQVVLLAPTGRAAKVLASHAGENAHTIHKQIYRQARLGEESFGIATNNFQHTLFIVDEAYVDFGGESCIPLLKDFKNLVIVRTFSKSLCGAGQRLGYIVASPELVNVVTTVKNSVNHFPLDALAQVSGTAACKDISYYVNTSKKVAEERDAFYNFLQEKEFYVIKSQTNFLFAKKDGIKGEDLYKSIKERGILIRHFNTPGIEDFVRITIGTKEQMQKLKAAFEDTLDTLK